MMLAFEFDLFAVNFWHLVVGWVVAGTTLHVFELWRDARRADRAPNDR